MLIGVGIDLVDVEAFKSDFGTHQTALQRTFSKVELDYCEASANQFQSLSCRFAAKEAFMKAVGTGSTDLIHFHDVIVENDVMGKPTIRLTGGAATLHQKLGHPRILLSMTHLPSIVSAVVILDKD